MRTANVKECAARTFVWYTCGHPESKADGYPYSLDIQSEAAYCNWLGVKTIAAVG